MIPKFEEYTKILTTDLYTYNKPQPIAPIKTSGVATNNTANDVSSWTDRVVAATKEVFTNLSTSGESKACARYTSNIAQHIINQIIDANLAPGKIKSLLVVNGEMHGTLVFIKML